jgi:hypothetical protein
MDAKKALTDVIARCRAEREQGRTPVVVFDLDHTLFDNGPRTWQILMEFADETGNDDLRGRLDGLPHTGLPYLLSETLERVGVFDEAIHKAAFAYWRERFFTDDYQRYDIPLRGAVEFANESFQAGATLVYLSGRDAPGMLVGCAASLRQHKFPVGVAHTTIVLKPDFETSDLDFKTDAVDYIHGLGTVVASFDNEPGNCNLFRRRWPNALTVFVKTQHAPNPPVLDPGVVTIEDFSQG